MKNPERPLTSDEKTVVEFLNLAIDAAKKNLDRLAEGRKFASCADQQSRLLSLQMVRDALVQGHHDKNHPMRRINPKDTAAILGKTAW